MPFKHTFIMCIPVPAHKPFNWSIFPRPLGVLATGCFFLALASTAQELDVVTCKTSPETVTAGKNVSVTFNFPFDVSQMRMVAVTVDHYSLNGFDPERVFQCLKLGAENHTSFTTREGYSLEGEVKTSLTLRMTGVSPEHSGRIICHVMIPERKPLQNEPCSLWVLDVLDVSSTTTTEPAKPAVTTDLGGQGSDGNDWEWDTTSWLITLLLISMTLLLTMFVFNIFVTIRRRKRIMDKWPLPMESLRAKRPDEDGTPLTAVTPSTAVADLEAGTKKTKDPSRRADEKNDENDQGEEKTDGGRGDGVGGAGKDDKDKDSGEENEGKEPLLDA